MSSFCCLCHPALCTHRSLAGHHLSGTGALVQMIARCPQLRRKVTWLLRSECAEPGGSDEPGLLTDLIVAEVAQHLAVSRTSAQAVLERAGWTSPQIWRAWSSHGRATDTRLAA